MNFSNSNARGSKKDLRLKVRFGLGKMVLF
jgi:hypothetical protein